MAFRGSVMKNRHRRGVGIKSNLPVAKINFAEVQGTYAQDAAKIQIENGSSIFGSVDDKRVRIAIEDSDPLFFFNDAKSKENSLPQVLSSLSGYNGLQNAPHTVDEQRELLKGIVKDESLVERFLSEIVREDLTFVGIATQRTEYSELTTQTTIAIHGMNDTLATGRTLLTGDRIAFTVPTIEQTKEAKKSILQTQGAICGKVTLRPTPRVPRDEATAMREEYALYLRNTAAYFKLHRNRVNASVPARVAAMEHKTTNQLFNGLCMVRWLVANGVLVVRSTLRQNISDVAEPIYNMIAYNGTGYSNKSSNNPAVLDYSGYRADYLVAALAGAFGVIDPTAQNATADTIPQGRAFAVMQNNLNLQKCVKAREEILASMVCDRKIKDSHMYELGYRGPDNDNVAYKMSVNNVHYVDMSTDIGRLLQVQQEAVGTDAGALLNYKQINDNFTAGVVTEGASNGNRVEFYMS